MRLSPPSLPAVRAFACVVGLVLLAVLLVAGSPSAGAAEPASDSPTLDVEETAPPASEESPESEADSTGTSENLEDSSEVPTEDLDIEPAAAETPGSNGWIWLAATFGLIIVGAVGALARLR